MTGQKHTGSFYTPDLIAKFIVDRVLNKNIFKNISMLEPSAGDGIFIKEIIQSKKNEDLNIHITAVEIVHEEFKKVSTITTPKNIQLTAINDDFLKFQKNYNEQFDFIIGNPPYIKRSLLSNEQSQLCHEINSSFSTKSSSVKNIWNSFLLSSFKLLNKNGTIALILPSEFLQVGYAEVSRRYLLENFDRIEVYTFNDLVFKTCKGQDTVILIAEKKSKDKGLFFFNINNIKNQINDINLVKHDTSSSLKWTSHILETDEIELLENLSSKLMKISDFCTSKTGIVTAANNFFIINDNKIKELNAHKSIYKPILSKSSVLPKGIIFDSNDFDEISRNEGSVFLLDLNNVDITNYKDLKNYIAFGENNLLHKRYKMLKRNFWYEVPNIGSPSPILFFKRCHNFPRMIINDANVLATDSAYLVYPKENIDMNSLVYSFYNSLTLAMAEIQGRFYGGGVLELTPLEFKSLPLPYLYQDITEISKLNDIFKNESDIELICERNDQIFLQHYFPNIDDQILKKLSRIRKKLVKRRQRL